MKGNLIFRQELKSLTPKCDAKCAIIFMVILILIFIGTGLPIMLSANSIKEYSKEYSSCKLGEECHVEIKVDELMKAPIFLYYELDNFYMNHRDFVKSRSYPQLRGEVHYDNKVALRCEGALFMSEIFDNDTSKYKTWSGKRLKGSDVANPCGLIAKSYFTDTYTLLNDKAIAVTINEIGISNDYDRQYMFKRYNESDTRQWIDVENGKLYSLFRAFYSLDANGIFSKF